jgi:hypothetical protein
LTLPLLFSSHPFPFLIHSFFFALSEREREKEREAKKQNKVVEKDIQTESSTTERQIARKEKWETMRNMQ